MTCVHLQIIPILNNSRNFVKSSLSENFRFHEPKSNFENLLKFRTSGISEFPGLKTN